MYNIMVPRFWAEEFDFSSSAETSDFPALDAAGWFTDFGKNFILLFFKPAEPHN